MALAETNERIMLEQLEPEIMDRVLDFLDIDGRVQIINTMALEEESESTMLEQLAPELMVRVLGFLDIVGRVQLAGCNTRVQKRVFVDCSQVFRIIRFDHVKGRQNLTDGQLSKLLTRVQAKQVTEQLSLVGCNKIHGHGLSPLRFSTVLETVDVTGTQAKKNLTPFLWILYTLLPFKFWALRVDDKLLTSHRRELTDFTWKLREAKLQQATETLCSACQDPVVDPSRQVVPSALGMPETFCSECHQPFCKKASCDMCVRECVHCHESFCENCKDVRQCSFCGRSRCNTKACGGATFTSCETCGKLCCKDCEGLVNCDYCKKRKTCLDCAAYDICNKDCTLCVTCQSKGDCSVCNGTFCVNCIKEQVRQCHRCRLVFCDAVPCQSMVEHCSATVCNLVHCKNCRDFEFCITCERSFCLEHDRLVDCFQCGMRHCRTCGHQKMCPWCQRPCFDDCCCAERYPKKAKTSPVVTQK